MQTVTFESNRDSESEYSLRSLDDYERIVAQKVSGVHSVLVVLSSAGMPFDLEAFKQKIKRVYGEVKIYFLGTMGKPIGQVAPGKIDLLIDMTGPRQRQPWLLARKLRRRSRFAVGRDCGFFRSRIYDRVYRESEADGILPEDTLQREEVVQTHVLILAGIPVLANANLTPDLAKTIALQLGQKS